MDSAMPESHLDFDNFLRFASDVISSLDCLRTLDVFITGQAVMGATTQSILRNKTIPAIESKWGGARQEFYDLIDENESRKALAKEVALKLDSLINASDGDTLFVSTFLRPRDGSEGHMSKLLGLHMHSAVLDMADAHAVNGDWSEKEARDQNKDEDTEGSVNAADEEKEEAEEQELNLPEDEDKEPK